LFEIRTFFRYVLRGKNRGLRFSSCCFGKMTSQARISKNGRSFDAVQTTNNDLGYLLRAVAPYIVALFPQKMFFLLLSLVMMDRLFLSLKLSLLACMRFVNCNSTTTYYSSTASYPKIIAVPYESKTTFIREQARQFLLFANRGKRAMRTTNRPHQTVIFEEQKSYTLSSKSKKAIRYLRRAKKLYVIFEEQKSYKCIERCKKEQGKNIAKLEKYHSNLSRNMCRMVE